MRNSSSCFVSRKLVQGSIEKAADSSVTPANATSGTKNGGAAGRTRSRTSMAAQPTSTAASSASAAAIDTWSAATKPSSSHSVTLSSPSVGCVSATEMVVAVMPGFPGCPP